MIAPILTHIADSPAKTVCGLPIPPCPAIRQPVRGSRVGIIKGDFVAAGYVITQPESDSNAPCELCIPSQAR